MDESQQVRQRTGQSYPYGCRKQLGSDKVLSDHYRPGRWVPHVTLAKDLAEPSQALRAVKNFNLPIPATLGEVNLIHFRPPQVLWRSPPSLALG
jgi:hypothetical protein